MAPLPQNDPQQQQPSLSLDDFTDYASYGLSDFMDTDDVGELPPPQTNPPSNRNQAATTALLNSNDPQQQVATYQTINNELVNHGSSPTMKEVADKYVAAEQDKYRRVTADYLANPEISDEWKVNAISAVNNRDNPIYNTRALLGTKEAAQPVENETTEAADLRGVWAAGIADVMTYQRDQQKALNAMRQKDEASDAPEAVAFGEDIIPLVSGAKNAGMVRSLGGDTLEVLKGFFLPGSAKAKLAQDFNNLPLSERKAAMEAIGNALSKDGKTIFLPDSIDQANYEAYQNIIQSGSYTMSDTVVDNIFGLLDITGIGHAITKSAKAAKIAGEAAEAASIGEKAFTATDSARSWARRFIASDVQPTTPSQTLKDANPDKARQVYSAVEADDTGDLASTLYGTTREQAIAHDLAPQPSSVAGGGEEQS